MDSQTSTGYDVDNRYSGLGSGPKASVPGWKATDNERGKEFPKQYMKKPGANLTADRREDNRFIVSSPGWGETFTFKNAFGSPRSAEQRRIVKLNQ